MQQQTKKEVLIMKLIELLNGNTDLDCGVVFGDVDCPDIVWDAEDTITDKGYNAWADVLNREAVYDEDNNVLIVDDVDPNRGEQFCYALAGYVGETLYCKWFKTALNNDEWDN